MICLSRVSQQSRGLIFQFVLNELIQSLQVIHQIQKQVEARCTPHQITDSASKLLCFSRHSKSYFSWSDDGCLSKLKDYCLNLSHLHEKDDKDVAKMEHIANQIWLHGLHLLDCLRTADGQEILADLELLIKKIEHGLQQLATTAFRCLKLFYEDENVLYFVIRHHKELNHLFGTEFISTQFKKLYPKKTHKDLVEFIVDRYNQRGFGHLGAQIESLMAALEV